MSEEAGGGSRDRSASVPRLHVLATDEVAAEVDVAAAGRRLLAGCGPELALHLRLREATGRELHDLAGELSGEADRRGGWCVVNGRLDVALTAGAQAVQLGSGALPVGRAVEVAADAGVPLAVGASVHGAEEARDSAADGANYLLLGTIFATPSHPGREGAGPGLVAACADLPVPVVAIGGVDRGRVPEVTEAGAHGVAVVRAVWTAPDPVAAARELLEALGGEPTT